MPHANWSYQLVDIGSGCSPRSIRCYVSVGHLMRQPGPGSVEQCHSRLVLLLGGDIEAGSQPALHRNGTSRSIGICSDNGGKLDPIAAFFFCPIQGFVGGFQHHLRIVTGFRKCRYSDRYGDPRQGLRNIAYDQSFDFAAELLGSARSDVGVCSGQQDDELLAATSARDILVSEKALQAVADGPQHGIAGVMAMIIVVFLEMIDIDRQDADALPCPRRSRKFATTGFQHVPPVVKAVSTSRID